MKLKDITTYLEEWAPPETAAKWDNVGLQIGHPEAEVRTILLSLDVDDIALNRLQEKPYDLVITHHPVFFKPVSRIHYTTDLGRIIKTFVSQNIHLYSMHTNLDIAPGGVNDCLIRSFGLDPEKGREIRDGFGKYFECDTPYSLKPFIQKYALRRIGETEPDPVRRIGFCCGSGKSLLADVAKLELDVYITGELGYHEEIYCRLNNITTYLMGHKESEVGILDEIKTRLNRKFPLLPVDIIR